MKKEEEKKKRVASNPVVESRRNVCIHALGCIVTRLEERYGDQYTVTNTLAQMKQDAYGNICYTSWVKDNNGATHLAVLSGEKVKIAKDPQEYKNVKF